MNKPLLRKAVIVVVQVALTVGLLLFSLSNFNAAEVLAGFRSITVPVILGCVALGAVQIGLLVERWRIVLGSMQLQVPRGFLLQGILIERLFSQILPAAIGGDAARAAYLIGQKSDPAVTITSIIYDRISGILGLILLAGVCALLYKPFHLPAAVALVPLLLLLMMLVLMATVALLPRLWIERIFGLIPGLRLKAFALTGHDLLRDSNYSVRSLVVSALVQLLSCAMMMAIAGDLAPQVSLLHIGLLAPVLFLAMTLPLTIAGWGVREQAALLLFGHAGASAAVAIGISVVFGLLQLLIALISILVFVANALGRSRQGDAAQLQ